MESEQVRARISSKKAHIRYLENRMHDHTPILAEIKRREEEILKHQTAIQKLQDMLSDIPSCLEQAKRELRTLETRLQSLNGRTTMTSDDILARIVAIQAKIEELRKATQ